MKPIVTLQFWVLSVKCMKYRVCESMTNGQIEPCYMLISSMKCLYHCAAYYNYDELVLQIKGV